MFGKVYFHNPKALLSSFTQMSQSYEDKGSGDDTILYRLFRVYVSVFGVPEIGFQLRHLYFLRTIKKCVSNTPKKILDAGCGVGSYSILLSRMFPKSNISAVDIDNNKLKSARDLVKKLNERQITFSYMDITKKYIRSRNKYDLIVNIDVLEHIKDYKGVIKNFYKMLSKEGYVYIHTPQPNQKRIFGQLKSWEHKDHVREGIEFNVLKNDLRKAGFDVIGIVNTHGFFGKLAWELNHIFLSKSLLLAGLTFPLLYVVAKLDLLVNNKSGLCTAVIAQKK